MEQNKLVEELRRRAKADPRIKQEFREYGVKLDDIDLVSITFADLDVSAKTKDCAIYLNRKLIHEKTLDELVGYLVHELVHYAQQRTGQTAGSEARDYLDKDTEMESFKAQVDYLRRKEGPEEALEYVLDLLDYHGLNGKKRRDKQEELLGK
jgi:hypothetical protein